MSLLISTVRKRLPYDFSYVLYFAILVTQHSMKYRNWFIHSIIKKMWNYIVRLTIIVPSLGYVRSPPLSTVLSMSSWFLVPLKPFWLCGRIPFFPGALTLTLPQFQWIISSQLASWISACNRLPHCFFRCFSHSALPYPLSAILLLLLLLNRHLTICWVGQLFGYDIHQIL